MVEFIIPAEVFTNFLKAISIVDEARLHITNDGLKVTAVEPSNVVMVIANVKRESLLTLNGEGIFGIEVKKLLDFAKLLNPTSNVEIKFGDEMRLVSENINFSTAVIDEKSVRRDPKIPDEAIKHFTVKARVDAREFRRAVKIARSIDETVEIGRDQSLFVRASSELEKVKIQLEEDEGAGQGIAAYDAERLLAMHFDEKLTVELANDFLARLSSDYGLLSWAYLIAPRVRN